MLKLNRASLRLLQSVRPLFRLYRNAGRRWWRHGERLHIELSPVREIERAPYFRKLCHELEQYPSVDDVFIVSHLARVVVVLGDHANDIAPYLDIVDRISAEFRPATGVSPDARFDHPADNEAEDRIEAELIADIMSIALGLGLRLLKRTPDGAEASIARLVSLLDNTPQLKNWLAQRFGHTATDVSLGLANSVGQGVAAGPVSPLIDLFVQRVRQREVRAQRELWWALEKDFFSAKQPSGVEDPDDSRRPGRPVPLKRGAVEKYAEDAWQTSLGAFAVSVADSGQLSRALTPLMAAIPKPALIAREVFAATIATRLAQRGVLLMTPRRLRYLDRIDTVVFDQRLLESGRLQIGAVQTVGNARQEEIRAAMRELYDPDNPTAEQGGDGWFLHPIESVDWNLAPVVRGHVRRLSADDTRILILSRARRTRAVIQLRPTPSPSSRALVRVARESGLRVCMVSSRPRDAAVFRPDEVWTPKDAVEELRDLQREGRTVLCCALGDAAYLPHGDLALLVRREDKPVNRPVDIIASHGLKDAAFLMRACAGARRTSAQGIQLTVMGTAIAAGNLSQGLQRANSNRISDAVNLSAGLALAAASFAARKIESPPDSDDRAEIPWHAMPHDSVLADLESDDNGISESEACQRRVTPPPSPGFLQRYARSVIDEMANPLTPMLAAGAGISASVGSAADAGIIGGVVAFNGLFSGWQRYRSERAIEALQHDEDALVCVMRDGQLAERAVSELVVGDVILLRSGDVVPADARILHEEAAEVDESSLTGESLPAQKSSLRSFAAALGDRHSMIYAGTAVTGGEIRAVVVAVGEDTEISRSVRAAAVESRSTGVDARLEELMRLTMPTAIGSSALLMGAGLLRGIKPHALVEASVNLAVASVPEGLPLLASSAELAAARRLSVHGALVRKPKVMEALGRMDVLCLDKTGTLTTGELKVAGALIAAALNDKFDFEEELVTPDDISDACDKTLKRLLRCARFATPEEDEEEGFEHRDDQAVHDLAVQAGIERDEALVIDELPFSSDRMLHATAVSNGEDTPLLCTKGAPEEIIERCSKICGVSINNAKRQNLLRHVEHMASQGLRLMAIAEGAVSNDELDERDLRALDLLGFLALRDPLRIDSADTLQQLRDAGIRTVMLTGDHPGTAEAIGRKLGLVNGQAVLTGPEIEALDDEALADRLAEVSVVARAGPSHKLRLVQALQNSGCVVGMTGDGGNDAPAIRLADVGIALGANSSEAARDACDLLVIDSRLPVILEAIAEGRSLWGAVRDATSLLVGGNLGEIAFMTVGGIINGTPPLGARQLMLVNLFTDVAPALTIAVRRPQDKANEQLLADGPERALGVQLHEDIVWRGLVTGGTAGGAYLLSRMVSRNPRSSSTVGLVSLVGTQLGQTLMAGGWRDPQLLLSATASAAGLFAAVMIPGVSGALGSKPLGPINLAIAMGASVLGTVVGGAIPRAHRRRLIAMPGRLRVAFGKRIDSLLEGVQDEQLRRIAEDREDNPDSLQEG